ncbi:MAG: hypothetical protein AB1546_05635 [bacterium]
MSKKVSEKVTIRIELFCILIDGENRAEEFIDELEWLCKEYSQQEDFFFNFRFEG